MSKVDLAPSKKTQRKMKRTVNDKKVEIAVAGAVVATVATGIGLVSTVVANKRRKKAKLEELETENERLGAIINTLSRDLMEMLEAEEYEEEDTYCDCPECGCPACGFPYDEEAKTELGEHFDNYLTQLADSLEEQGDRLAKQFKANETIVFLESDFLDGLLTELEEDAKGSDKEESDSDKKDKESDKKDEPKKGSDKPKKDKKVDEKAKPKKDESKKDESKKDESKKDNKDSGKKDESKKDNKDSGKKDESKKESDKPKKTK